MCILVDAHRKAGFFQVLLKRMPVETDIPQKFQPQLQALDGLPGVPLMRGFKREHGIHAFPGFRCHAKNTHSHLFGCS